MSRLLWAAAGFLGGVAYGRSAPQLPVAFGLWLAVTWVACGLVWFAAYRGKSSAVASAVAIAQAQAIASSESQAAAIAQAAVHLHLGGSVPESIMQSAVERVVSGEVEGKDAAAASLGRSETGRHQLMPSAWLPDFDRFHQEDSA